VARTGEFRNRPEFVPVDRHDRETAPRTTGVPEAPAPNWVREWQASRADRVSRAVARRDEARNGGEGTGRAVGEKAAIRRAEQVAAGLDELNQ